MGQNNYTSLSTKKCDEGEVKIYLRHLWMRPNFNQVLKNCSDLLTQCYTEQELEEINGAVLNAIVTSQGTIIGLMTRFKPGEVVVLKRGSRSGPDIEKL